MSTTRPPADEPLLAAPFEAVTRWALRFPYLTLALAAAVAVAALALTVSRLEYRTGRMDLLDPGSDYNRLWSEYVDEFGADDDAVVVVEGAGPEQVVPVLREISAALAREEQLFHAVLHEIDLSKVQAKGLHYLSADELLGIEQFLDEAAPIVQGDWSRLNLGNRTATLCAQLDDARLPPAARQIVSAEVQRLASGMLAALEPERTYRSPWPEMPLPDQCSPHAPREERHHAERDDYTGVKHLLSPDGRLGFVLLRLAPGEDSFARGSQAIDALRERIAEARARHPEVSIGLTGLPILENDEMRGSSSSMLWASLLSLAGVAVLLVAGFGGVRHALLANLVLLVGMAWAFGYVTLAVGHLNILSVSFTVTLIGIGIDYGIHYVARYLQLRRQGQPCREALLATSRSISPAIATGAVTTAIAFFAAAFTSFTGIAELGLIAGGGILLCAVAELVVLPAAILLVDRTAWGTTLPEPLPVHAWIAPLMRRSRTVLAVTLLATPALSLGIGRLWYDHNLLNLQAQDLESVVWEHKLVAGSQQSVWYALSIADTREELLARRARLLELGSIERIEEIVSLLPADAETKQPIIARIQERLASLPQRPPLIGVDRPADLSRILDQAQQLVGQGRLDARCAGQLGQIRNQLAGLPAAECYAALSQYQQHMADDLLARLHVLQGMADPQPPQLADLPDALVHRFVGRHGRHLLKVYGRGNIWDMQALERFVADVRSVDPRATGHPLQAYEASREMKQSYETAALYALVVILGVLLFDFRNVRDALMAAAPLGLGVVQMFGLLGLLGIPLNPANMIALPLILGIGVDYGVHIVHEYRNSRGPYRMSPSTALAVLVDSLTTIVGFASLMIASHQGLQSLGRVLTIGVSCCLFTSLVILPAFLTWITRHRSDELRPLEAEPQPAATPMRRRAKTTVASAPCL